MNLFSFLHSSCEIGEETTVLIFQVSESSLLNDFAVFNNSDSCAFLDCSQSVGDNYRSPVLHDIIQSRLHFSLRFFIQGTCSFVKDKNSWLSDNSSSNCNSLLLTSREFATLDTTGNVKALMHMRVSHLSRSFIEFTFQSLEFSFILLFDVQHVKLLKVLIIPLVTNSLENSGFLFNISMKQDIGTVFIDHLQFLGFDEF
jgi:hypothetical protein